MKLLTGIRIALGAILAALLAAGCVPLQRAAAPAASPSASPAELQYDADPLAWLAQKANEGPSHEALSPSEIDQITDLAYLSLLMNLCLQTQSLDKWGILSPLYLYYQDVSFYDQETDTYAVRTNIPFAPDGIGEDEDYVYTSAQTAAAFIRAVLGAEIPDQNFAFGDWELSGQNTIVCRNNIYYILRGDYLHVSLRLRAYQSLGDGVFYVSFDGDDSDLPSGSENQHGNMPDYYRLLVVRSDSAWGFTVKAKLKEGDDSLLPVDFPLPLYAA